jgi:transcriptional repressor NrdR
MRCPSCRFDDTRVIDSRMSSSGVAIRRRRACSQCDFRFSTVEEVQILDLAVIKRDGTREPYSRTKMQGGLAKSFEKRPISSDDFLRLVQIIERDIQLLKKTEVSTKGIGDIVMKRLKQVDDVAYIRFASVYQGFKDAEMFHRAIEQLNKREGRPAANKNHKAKSKKTKRRK